MKHQGKCYCGAIRYESDADPVFKLQCHCRECQYISGGMANVVMALPEDSFSYSQGEPKQFRRADLDNPVTREFCDQCGTSLTSRSPNAPGMVMVKVGTLDDPATFSAPQMAIFTCDRQEFQHLPEGVPAFEKTPG